MTLTICYVLWEVNMKTETKKKANKEWMLLFTKSFANKLLKLEMTNEISNTRLTWVAPWSSVWCEKLNSATILSIDWVAKWLYLVVCQRRNLEWQLLLQFIFKCIAYTYSQCNGGGILYLYWLSRIYTS